MLGGTYGDNKRITVERGVCHSAGLQKNLDRLPSMDGWPTDIHQMVKG